MSSKTPQAFIVHESSSFKDLEFHISRFKQQIDPIWEASFGDYTEKSSIELVQFSLKDASVELHRKLSMDAIVFVLVHYVEQKSTEPSHPLENMRLPLLQMEYLTGKSPFVFVCNHLESQHMNGVCSMEVRDSAMKEGFTQEMIENSLFSFNARLSKSQQSFLFDTLASTAAAFAPIPAKIESLTIVTEDNSGADVQMKDYVSNIMRQKSFPERPLKFLNIISRDDAFSVNSKSFHILAVDGSQNRLYNNEIDQDFRMVLHRIFMCTGRTPLIAIYNDPMAIQGRILSAEYTQLSEYGFMMPYISNCFSYNNVPSDEQFDWLSVKLAYALNSNSSKETALHSFITDAKKQKEGIPILYAELQEAPVQQQQHQGPSDLKQVKNEDSNSFESQSNWEIPMNSQEKIATNRHDDAAILDHTSEESLFQRSFEVPDTNKNSFQNAWTYLEKLKGEHEAAMQSEALKSTVTGEDLIEKAKRLNERAEQEKNELIRRLKMREEQKPETGEDHDLTAGNTEESQTLIASEIPRSGNKTPRVFEKDSLDISEMKIGNDHVEKTVIGNSTETAEVDFSLIEDNVALAIRNRIASSNQKWNNHTDSTSQIPHEEIKLSAQKKEKSVSRIPDTLDEARPVKEEFNRLNSTGAPNDSHVRIPRVLPTRPSTDFVNSEVHRHEKNGHTDLQSQSDLEGQSSFRDHHRGQVEQCGVGVVLGLEKKTGKILITTVEAGSSAAKCGVHVGSVVVTIDGARVEGLQVTDVNEMLLGAAHTAVVIGLQDKRYGPEVRDFAVIRQTPRLHLANEKKIRSSTENSAYRSQSSSDLSTTSTEGRSSRQDLDGDPWPVQQSERTYKGDNQVKDRVVSDYENGWVREAQVVDRRGKGIKVLSSDPNSRGATPNSPSMTGKNQSQDFDAWLQHLEQHMVRGKSRVVNQSLT